MELVSCKTNQSLNLGKPNLAENREIVEREKERILENKRNVRDAFEISGQIYSLREVKRFNNNQLGLKERDNRVTSLFENPLEILERLPKKKAPPCPTCAEREDSNWTSDGKR